MKRFFKREKERESWRAGIKKILVPNTKRETYKRCSSVCFRRGFFNYLSREKNKNYSVLKLNTLSLSPSLSFSLLVVLNPIDTSYKLLARILSPPPNIFCIFVRSVNNNNFVYLFFFRIRSINFIIIFILIIILA